MLPLIHCLSILNVIHEERKWIKTLFTSFRLNWNQLKCAHRNEINEIVVGWLREKVRQQRLLQPWPCICIMYIHTCKYVYNMCSLYVQYILWLYTRCAIIFYTCAMYCQCVTMWEKIRLQTGSACWAPANGRFVRCSTRVWLALIMTMGMTIVYERVRTNKFLRRLPTESRLLRSRV